MKDVLELAVRFSPCQQRSAEETFLEVQDLIRKQVWGLIRTYGGDFDEMMAEASYLFIAAYNDWDGIVPFTTWVSNWIRWSLIDQLRIRIGHQARYTYVDDEVLTRNINNWQPADLLEELSTDAAMVVKLVLETPAEIASIIEGKGGQPRNYRSTIRSYLISLGWTAKQISDSFAEIRAALLE